jgi:phage protein D
VKPEYKILINNEDVTSNLSPYLISIEVKDNASDSKDTDSFTISLHDVRDEIIMPELNQEIEIFLGYQFTVLFSVGKFIIDNVTVEGRPNKITFSGKSASFVNTVNLQNLQTKKSRTWTGEPFTANGQREDGTWVGSTGYLGILKNANGETEIEHRILVTIDGKEIYVPALVSTLTIEEVAQILIGDTIDEGSVIYQKVIAHARQRLSVGLSQYCSTGNANTTTVTIKDVLNFIANEHGLTPCVDPELGEINIGTLHQTDESDPHLINRLAEQYGATFKISYDKLLFIKKGNKSDGQSAETLKLYLDLTTTWSYTRNKKSGWKSCTGLYKIDGNEQPQETITGYGQPSFRLRNIFKNKSDADYACLAFLEEAKREGLIFSAKTIGNARMFAGAKISLDGFPYQHGELSGDWVLTSVNHYLSSNGFTTDLEARPPDRTVG